MSDSKILQDLISKGDVLAVKKLLQKKARLATQVLPSGISPLMLAAYHRNKKLVETIRDHYKSLNIYEAAALGDLLQLELVLAELPDMINRPAADGFSALGLATFFGQTEVVAYLLTKGAEINAAAQNDFKVTALHSAAATGNLEIARLLLDNLADPNMKQAKGVTALHSAAHRGDDSMAALLVARGAKKDSQMEDGRTPVELALEGGHKKLAQWLKK